MSETIRYMSIGFFLLFIYKLFYGFGDLYISNNNNGDNVISTLSIIQMQHDRQLNDSLRSLQSMIIFSDEVRDALSRGEPVVALESTIISHGMPYPQNYQTAMEVEEIVRQNGATPATIALINGTIRVGLDQASLLHLSTVGRAAIKTSRRDLALVLSQSHLTGSTTVSATIFISNLVGIKMFVTGGLGGVHRGAETTMDISADLTELGKNDVTVISAGVKSILDIGKTLEYLETQGVTVITYGSDYFPSFFTAKSEFKTPNRLDSYLDCAKLIDANHRLRLNSGIVIAVPNSYPSTKDVDGAISEAVKEAESLHISGKETTPFLLKRVNELTDGKSLESNIHLVKENAKVGSLIAVELAKLKRISVQQPPNQPEQSTSQQQDNQIKKTPDITIVGGAVIDLVSHPNKETGFQMGTSNPGKMHVKAGGVGRNVAEVIGRLQMETLFISLVGDDVQSNLIIDQFKSLNMSIDGIKKLNGETTATYNAIMNEGDLAVAISIMDIFEKITPEFIDQFRSRISESKMIIFDGNIPVETMAALATIGKQSKIPVVFEPTSVYKSSKLITNNTDNDILPMITYATPNFDELLLMSQRVCERPNNKANLNKMCNRVLDFQTKDIESLEAHSRILLEAGIQSLIVKYGENGVYLVEKQSNQQEQQITMKHFPAPAVGENSLVDVTGAGDSMVGCIGWSIVKQLSIEEAMKVGSQCALYTLLSTQSVAPEISLNNIKSSITV